MSSGAPSERPLGAFERSMWMAEQAVTTNSLVISEVEGPLDVPLLRRALACVQARHPLLRVRVALEEEQPHFRTTSLAAPVRVMEGCWQDEVVRQLREPVDWASGPAFRCTIVAGRHNRCTLMLCFSHVIVDGFSMVTVMRELLEAASLLLLGVSSARPAMLPRAPIEGMLPARVRGWRAVAPMVRFLAREKRSSRGVGRPYRIADRDSLAPSPPPAFMHRVFEPDATAALRAAARQREVTMQSTLASLLLLGIADELDLDAEPLWLGTSVDLRSELRLSGFDDVGLFVSLLGSTQRVRRDQPWWVLARSIARDNASRLAGDEALLSFPIGSRMFAMARPWLPPNAAGGRRLVRLMQGLLPAGASLSNLGDRTLELPAGSPLSVTSLHFVAAESVLPITSTVLSYGGRLHWNFLNWVGTQGDRAVARAVERACLIGSGDHAARNTGGTQCY